MLTYDNIIFYEPEKSTTTDEIRYNNIKKRTYLCSFLYIANEKNEKMINKFNYTKQRDTSFLIGRNYDNTSRIITHQDTQNNNNNVKFSKNFLHKRQKLPHSISDRLVMISSNISDHLVMIWSSLKVVGACVIALIIDITLLLIRIRKTFRRINKILRT